MMEKLGVNLAMWVNPSSPLGPRMQGLEYLQEVGKKWHTRPLKPFSRDFVARFPTIHLRKEASQTVTAQPEYEPTSNYEMRNIEGWTIYVNHRLLHEQKELGRDFLRLVEVKLYGVNRIIPQSALKELHKVAIWLEANNEDVTCACYHPSEQWLREHGFNPDKAKSIEIGNAVNFINWSLHQPMMVLHELAHGYHHQTLGYDNPDIKAAYARAVESRIYESVLRYDGKQTRAYALNNDQEYFAEQSEAFFGTNDFYPFVRTELMEHDPLMYETLRRLWES